MQPNASCAVCTLFEGNYHFGVAGLANSLYQNGYRGTIFVGYRGDPPPWARCKESDFTYHAADGLDLKFIALETKVHLTNYKADFMLEVWEKHCQEAEKLFYFDPDIIIICKWSFFESWVDNGIALCQDVNGQMSYNHPVRNKWRKVYRRHGISLDKNGDVYLNAGFIGLSKLHSDFLTQWKQALDIASSEGASKELLTSGIRTDTFMVPDQDTLNISLMATDIPLSYVGIDGMDFQQGGGGFLMSHAIGKLKPWSKTHTLFALRGRGPSRTDRLFSKFVSQPIKAYSDTKASILKLDLFLARCIGRFL